jgi:hypothetical protein
MWGSFAPSELPFFYVQYPGLRKASAPGLSSFTPSALTVVPPCPPDSLILYLSFAGPVALEFRSRRWRFRVTCQRTSFSTCSNK